MKILAIVFISFLILGFLFVQWANKPENVAALQKKRKLEAAQKVKNEVVKAIVQKEIELKKRSLTLEIDEDFASNRFEKLDFHDSNISYFKFGNHEFEFSGMVTKGQSAQDYFITSKDDLGDFAAETQIGIWGGDAYAGIFWDAQATGNKNPKQYQAAYSSPDVLYVEADDKERFNLGGVIASENNQLLHVERFGKNLKVSVNGRILFNKQLASAGKGKIGLIIGHRGGNRNNVQSISIAIKRFRVWK
jgi:hypothetical protein